MNEVIKLLCKEISENKEEPINDKMVKLMESTWEINKNRKVTEVKSSNLNLVKERPTKVVDLEQGKNHDPTHVSFCKTSYKINVENKLKEKVKSVKWHLKLFLN